jgi:hypothetical protein
MPYNISLFLLCASAFCVGFVPFHGNKSIAIHELCISKEEKELYTLIMEYRKQRGLPEIPISTALSKVAQAHVRDLSTNEPHKKQRCNMHSWSSKGNWSSCCYTDNHAKASCMWNKPRELAGFNADGFEIAYGSENINFTIDPKAALAGWKSSEGHNAVLVNKGTWKAYQWKSIGVGIYKNYTCVWFAKEPDPQGAITVCE